MTLVQASHRERQFVNYQLRRTLDDAGLRKISIRALQAQRREVIRLLLRRSVTLIALGSAIGLAGAAAVMCRCGRPSCAARTASARPRHRRIRPDCRRRSRGGRGCGRSTPPRASATGRASNRTLDKMPARLVPVHASCGRSN